jgi:NADH dehydrogenase
MQQGKHLARNLINIINAQPTVPFKYFNKGTMATVGRNRAVADLGKLHFQGFFCLVDVDVCAFTIISGFQQ